MCFSKTAFKKKNFYTNYFQPKKTFLENRLPVVMSFSDDVNVSELVVVLECVVVVLSITSFPPKQVK